jgi:hypothetical protein
MTYDNWICKMTGHGVDGQSWYPSSSVGIFLNTTPEMAMWSTHPLMLLFFRYCSGQNVKVTTHLFKIQWKIVLCLQMRFIVLCCRDQLPESAYKYQLLGLNLLFLLSQNRVAEFHTELELLPADQIQSNVYIRHPLSLEQYLMEGSYNKVTSSFVYPNFYIVQHLLFPCTTVKLSCISW